MRILNKTIVLKVLFYFSSISRHTISTRDRSSEVCSDDLSSKEKITFTRTRLRITKTRTDKTTGFNNIKNTSFLYLMYLLVYTISQTFLAVFPCRSEERRVGKEFRM